MSSCSYIWRQPLQKVHFSNFSNTVFSSCHEPEGINRFEKTFSCHLEFIVQSVARGIESDKEPSLFRGTNFSTMISHPVLIPFFPRFFPVFDAFFSLLQELEGIGDVIIGDVTTVPCAWEGVCAGLPARVEVYICVSCGVCHGMRA